MRFLTPQNDGECIYHYTSSDAVMNILQKDKIVLQLTQADYMNDTTEGNEIYEHLKSACSDLLNEQKISKEQYEKILALQYCYSQEYPTVYLNNEKNIA